MLISSKTSDAFLALVRLGIGHGYSSFPEDVDWPAVKALAEQHGLSAIVLDGIKGLNINHPNLITTLDQDMRLEWIGEIMQDYEQVYDLYCRAISGFARWHNAHGYKMMILKGYACSLDWPKPEHRPCGDIDIWQFGRQKEADAELLKTFGNRTDGTSQFEIDISHHHHTVFEWNGFTVENHYDFINVHHHKSNAEYEKVLKELGQNDSHYVSLYGEKVYLPAPDLQALFLLKHIMMHFAAEGILLRQLLDWGFFVKAHRKKVDWKRLLDLLDQYGMKEMFNILNAICVEDLGFELGVFPYIQFNPYLKERVLNDILSPEFSEELPNDVVRRLIYKIRRWRGNAWKHKLCYKESMWSAFWSGVWNHLLKPSTI